MAIRSSRKNGMINRLAGCAFLVLAGAAAALAFPGRAAADGPAIHIGQTHFHAGTVVEGAIVSHAFIIKNRGTRPLGIQRVAADCGCTTAGFDRIIPPGRSGVLNVDFDTMNETGEQAKAVTVYSTDSRAPEITLTIAAHVLEAVRVKPDRIFFSGLTGLAREKQLRITTRGSHDLQIIVKNNMLPPGVGFHLERDGSDFLAVFKDRASAPGIFRGRIVFETNLKQRPYITVPVFSRVYDPVEILPARLDFGRIPQTRLQTGPSSRPEKHVRIQFHTQRDRIDGVEISDPTLFSATWTRLKTAGAYRVTVLPEPHPAAAPGKKTATLKIRTTHDGFSTIDIPVSIELF